MEQANLKGPICPLLAIAGQKQLKGPICPLLSIVYESASACALEMCAWYIEGRCAVKYAGEALRNAAGQEGTE